MLSDSIRKCYRSAENNILGGRKSSCKAAEKGCEPTSSGKRDGPVQRERPGRGLEGPAKATFNQTLEATARAVAVPKIFLLGKKMP